jgi:hypothetical protein
MDKLEYKLCKIAAHEQELGNECRGYLATIDEDLLVETFGNINLLPKYCQDYDWFGPSQFKCKYFLKDKIEKL